MKQKIYSTVVLLVFSVSLYLFSTLFNSSLLFEDNRSILNAQQIDPDLTISLKEPSLKDSFFYDTYIQNPAILELYLRASILSSDKDTEELKLLYKRLLKTRPSWPYYFSGLAQVNQLSDFYNSSDINAAIQYGKYERKVALSFAEILFYGWDGVKKKDQLLILNYLIGQQESTISRSINISAKFAKIYQYCDFIYEKKHVEYAACKQNYWQPLSD